jgi:hypothetical protein
MRDLAVTEHLAFAYAIGDDRRYGSAARKWILASCRAWQLDADGAPDGGKAYAVARVVLEPSYGQLDYYSPLLLFLAREYRRSTCQYLALWDHSLGTIQRTRYITPHGEQLLFAQGGYAYVWYDATVAGKADEHRLSYHFPSVDEAYLRTSWNADDLLVGVRKGELVMHGGGTAMLIEPEAWRQPPSDLSVVSVDDDGDLAVILCGKGEEKSMSIELHRNERLLSIQRRGSERWSLWCQETRSETVMNFTGQNGTA